MSRLVLALAIAASLVSGCVRPIFDGRSVSGTGPLTTDTTTDTHADPTADAHTRAFGI